MVSTKSLKVKVEDITNICYGVCIFVFVIGQSSLSSTSAVFAMLCKGVRLAASILPALLLLPDSKFSIRNLASWSLVAVFIIGNILFNEANSDLLYIVVFILYCSKSKPEDVLKIYYISASLGIALVIASWFIGILPSQTKGTREYLGFYFPTFGPNLFFSCSMAYIASRKNKIKLSRWILIEIINFWFYKKTDTLAVFLLIHASIILYYVLSTEKIKRAVFNGKVLKRILEALPFVSAAVTIIGQYFYNAHYQEPILMAANELLSFRLYYGKIAIERYGISLFGQTITWMTGTDGTKVSVADYFYVDSSYLQVLLRYGIIMLVVLCLAMMIVQRYSVRNKNVYMCLACSLFLIHCITDPQLLSFRYNPFLIISVACLGRIKTQKKTLPRKQSGETI